MSSMSTVKEDVQFILSKDCPVHKQSKYISAASTAVFWVVLLLCMVIVPARKPKEKYKTVQIVLASPEKKVVKKAEAPAAQKPSAAPKQEQAAPAEQPVTPPPAPAPAKVEQPKAETKPSQPKTQKTQSKPAAKTESKPAPAKTPVKQAEVVEYAMDMSDGVNFNAPAKKKTATWDDIEFSDDAAQSSQQTETKTVTSKSGVAGTAGTQSSTSTAKTTSQNQSVKENNQVSSTTTSALGKIANAKYVGNSSSSVQSEVNISASSSNGKVTVQMTDGSRRALIDPAEPVITISEENAKLIDSKRSVVIEFTVVASGNVPFSNVRITPESILPAAIRMEIIDQISEWRFESADFNSIARFEYNIVKR